MIICSCQKRTQCNIKDQNNKAKFDKLIVQAHLYSKKTINSDSAFYFFNEAKLLCNPKSDTENYIRILNSMASLQLSHGDYIGSETTLTEAMPYLKYIKKPLLVWDTYMTLGSNYFNTFDFKNALLYYNKALNLKINESKQFSTKTKIGNVLAEEKKYLEALNVFLSLADEIGVLKTSEEYAYLLNNIGFCYFKLDNPEGLTYINEALKIRTNLKNHTGIALSNLTLARYYDENNNSSAAKKFGLIAYSNLNDLQNIEDKQSALKLLIKNSNEDELKKYSMQYIDLIEHLFQIRQEAKNQFARIKYNSKREKEENLKLKTHKSENDLKLEKQKNKNIVSYIIIILSLFLVIILYFYLTSKANKEKIEAAYNSETRISKKLHDELANDIYHTMAFAENKNLSLEENKEQLLNNLDVIYSRTRDISKENYVITTDENYISSLKEMIYGLSTSNISIILNGLDIISWNEINKNKKITVYRVIQELLVNMRKYSDASVVGIDFKIVNKNLHVNYTDNGKGIDTDKMVFKNGLYNVKNRIQKIKGQIEISSAINQGFKVFFKFPL
ncbi:histidine kinase/DNA gyrase B/HSP90-like ATPase [Flavobacterium sp. 270]|nr:histidine kinase/DNA gyrase B/HSP90-like ATPase [Flavobacterium sp. 270]